MKAKPAMDPVAAFPDPANPPPDTALPPVLGRAAIPVALAIDNLRAVEPGVTVAWQFSPRSGWFRIYLLKKRRLFYLVPRRNDFLLSLIIGRKAVTQMQGGPFARQTAALLRTAQHYPEGIALYFDRRTLDPDLLAALLAAKLAS